LINACRYNSIFSHRNNFIDYTETVVPSLVVGTYSGLASSSADPSAVGTLFVVPSAVGTLVVASSEAAL